MKKVIIALVVFLVIQTGVCYYLIHRSEKKIVYADAIKLFDGYKLKTEMESASQGTIQKLKNSLDSATALYKVNPQSQEAQRLVIEKQQQLNATYTEVNKQINQKVWERLNPAIHEFGKSKNIDIMIGANGMGTLLYASDAWDVTDDLIKYVNASYEKGN